MDIEKVLPRDEIALEYKWATEDIYSSDEAFLEELKNEKTDDESVFGVCIYNVLATINSVPSKTKKSSQLTNALMEAKEEMNVICEIL